MKYTQRKNERQVAPIMAGQQAVGYTGAMDDIATVRAYCAAKRGATAGYPFGEGTLVFKVGGKMFALIGVSDGRPGINLKCDPDWALALRDIYPAVTPGYHMNKRHWNTVNFDGSIPMAEIEEMIDHSYDLVVNSLSRAQRASI